MHLQNEAQISLPEISLTIQWLRLCILIQEVWVQSLVVELRSYMSQGQKTKKEKKKKKNKQTLKQKQYCNKSNKNFKNGLYPAPKKKSLLLEGIS